MKLPEELNEFFGDTSAHGWKYVKSPVLSRRIAWSVITTSKFKNGKWKWDMNQLLVYWIFELSFNVMQKNVFIIKSNTLVAWYGRLAWALLIEQPSQRRSTESWFRLLYNAHSGANQASIFLFEERHLSRARILELLPFLQNVHNFLCLFVWMQLLGQWLWDSFFPHAKVGHLNEQ